MAQILSQVKSARLLRRLIYALVLLTLAPVLAAGESAGNQDSSPVNSAEQMDKPYLVLVSIDGFRWDFAGLQETPAMDRIAAQGLKADALQPVFPTLTFPNHYSIATGVPPARHGVVANEFPDESGDRWYHYKDRSTVQDGGWYLAEPIWVTAEKHGMVSAAFFFVGTEADVAGVRPSHWRAFDASVTGEDRVEQVLDWLSQPAGTRPHVITLYFEDVDEYTHWNGPGSTQSLDAIARVDAHLQDLLDGIQALPHGNEVYVLLVSDHGSAAYDASKPVLVLDRFIDLDGTRAVEGGPYAFIHFEQEDPGRAQRMRDDINRQWNCGRAMLLSEVPSEWNLGSSARYPDLVVMADPGCAVITSEKKRNKITAGDHGWPPDMPEMQGIFLAMGPGIPPGTRIGTVQAIDIYPLMLSILGLPAPHALGPAPEWLRLIDP